MGEGRGLTPLEKNFRGDLPSRGALSENFQIFQRESKLIHFQILIANTKYFIVLKM